MAHANDLGVGAMGFVAGGVIVANSFVKLDTTEGQVVACTALTDSPIGVAMTGATASGQQVLVQLYGIAKVRLQDTVATVGSELCVYNGGTGGADAAASLGGTVYVCAKALEAGVDGDTVAVLLLGPKGAHPTL